MRLSEHQAYFTIDLAHLALAFNGGPYRLVIGEVHRLMYQQEEHVRNGVSWTTDSDHLDKLAADVHLWIGGVYQQEAVDYLLVARFWESLGPLNYAGLLRWNKDGHHLGRKLRLRDVPKRHEAWA